MAKKSLRNESRTGDQMIRDWAHKLGTVTEAERLAGVCVGNLRIWLFEPQRGLRPETALAIAEAAEIPVEAIVYRWVPIKDLHMWTFV